MDAKSAHAPLSSDGVSKFRSPAQFLRDLAPEAVADLVGVAADVALIVENGIIKDVALGRASLVDEGYGEIWPGMAWVDTVTIESRPKIEDLLNQTPDRPAWRQVNHASKSAMDIPIKYAAIKIDDGARFIVIGRDESGMAVLQQRLVDAHQDLERDYARMRRAEGRYRLLFDSSSEAIMIVNSSNGLIEQTNAAGERIAGIKTTELAGTPLIDLFDPASFSRIEDFVTSTLSGDKTNLSDVPLRRGGSVDLSASAFREDQNTQLVLRLSDSGAIANDNGERHSLMAVLDGLPDGLVLADADQRIVSVNGTFADQVQLPSKQHARGAHLQSFLGRSTTDLNVLFSALKKHGVMRNFATVARDRFGVEDKVEVSAVAAPSPDGVIYAFAIRGVSRRIAPNPGLAEQLPNSSTDFTELVGRVPLKDIVKESTMLIERLCIEAALNISDNNRASAAEMLGLSRQGLYSKLKRGGIDTGS
jgi:transcriptional regulator PpsR